MAGGDNPNAKRLREIEKKNAKNQGPKSELHHSKGKPKSGVVKVKTKKKG